MAPKYQQLAQYLREQIEAGAYAKPVCCPRKRPLQKSSRLSRQTVRQRLPCWCRKVSSKSARAAALTFATFPSANRSPLPEMWRSSPPISATISSPASCGKWNLSSLPITARLWYLPPKTRFPTSDAFSPPCWSCPSWTGLLVEGTKTCLPNPNLDLYRQLNGRGIPLVFLNGNYAELTGTVSVLDDNYGGGYALVEYLYNKGHRQIAGIFKSDDIQGHRTQASPTPCGTSAFPCRIRIFSGTAPRRRNAFSAVSPALFRKCCLSSWRAAPPWCATMTRWLRSSSTPCSSDLSHPGAAGCGQL